jgi:multiple sugar transport system substrate-binding protein
VIKDFEAAHPDIRIKSEAISFTEIARQLVLRVRSGNPPDVSEVAGNERSSSRRRASSSRSTRTSPRTSRAR